MTRTVGGLPLASCTENFPYLVIEYFRMSTTADKISDIQLKIKAQSSMAGKLKKVYCETTDSFAVTSLDVTQSDNRVYGGRWNLVELICVIEPSATQTYFSHSLNHAHYSVHPLEYDSYCAHLTRFKQSHSQHPTLRFCGRDTDHDIQGYLFVRNKLSAHIGDIIHSFPLQKMIMAIQEHGKVDEKRGNHKLDTGLASGLCQKRLPEWFGIAGPNQLVFGYRHVVVPLCGQSDDS
jgi:hypothetical protein